MPEVICNPLMYCCSLCHFKVNQKSLLLVALEQWYRIKIAYSSIQGITINAIGHIVIQSLRKKAFSIFSCSLEMYKSKWEKLNSILNSGISVHHTYQKNGNSIAFDNTIWANHGSLGPIQDRYHSNTHYLQMYVYRPILMFSMHHYLT